MMSRREKIDLLNGFLNSASLEDEVCDGLSSAMALADDSELDVAIRHFENSRKLLAEFWALYDGDSVDDTETSDSVAFNATEATKSFEPKQKKWSFGAPNFQNHFDYFKLKIEDERFSLWKGELEDYLEKMDTYTRRTGDAGSLTKMALLIANLLFTNLHKHGREAVEVANTFVERALAWQPNNPETFVAWASCRIANSDYDNAKLIFLEAVRRFPKSVSIATKFSVFLVDRLNEYSSARKIIEDHLIYNEDSQYILTNYFDVICRTSIDFGFRTLKNDIERFRMRYRYTPLDYGTVGLFTNPKLLQFSDSEIRGIINAVAIKAFEIRSLKFRLLEFRVHPRVVSILDEMLLKLDVPANVDATVISSSKAYAKNYRRGKNRGRGFQFFIEHQISGVQLEPLGEDIVLMSKFREYFTGGQIEKINNLIKHTQHSVQTIRALSYGRLLLIKGGHLVSDEFACTDFATAFELVLQGGDRRTLELLAERFPRQKALCLLAQSVLGDERAFEEIASTISSGSRARMAYEIPLEESLRQTGLYEEDRLAEWSYVVSNRATLTRKLSFLNMSRI